MTTFLMKIACPVPDKPAGGKRVKQLEQCYDKRKSSTSCLEMSCVPHPLMALALKRAALKTAPETEMSNFG